MTPWQVWECIIIGEMGWLNEVKKQGFEKWLGAHCFAKNSCLVYGSAWFSLLRRLSSLLHQRNACAVWTFLRLHANGGQHPAADLGHSQPGAVRVAWCPSMSPEPWAQLNQGLSHFFKAARVGCCWWDLRNANEATSCISRFFWTSLREWSIASRRCCKASKLFEMVPVTSDKWHANWLMACSSQWY